MSGRDFPEGQSRLLVGYGAVDNAWATMEHEGVFSDEYGLEKYYITDLNARYAAEIGGADLTSTMEKNLSPVPLGRPPVIGEDFGQGPVLRESQLVPITKRPQPEALGTDTQRQPEADLWRAVDTFTIPGVPPEYTTPVLATVGIVALGAILYYLKKTRKI